MISCFCRSYLLTIVQHILLGGLHMEIKAKTQLIISTLSTALLLQACGGGSSSSSEPIPPVEPPAQNIGIIATNDVAEVGQPTELILFYPNDTLSDVSWQQTAGDPLTFHAKNSKVISFAPTSSGNYSFTVSFSRNGSAQQLNYTLDVDNTASSIATRLGHATIEGSKVSLRTHLVNSSLSSSSIRWTQTSGPNISFDGNNNGKTAIFFTAPNVNNDTILEFNVSASDGSTTYQDKVAILVEAAPNIATDDDNAYDKRLATVFPYNAQSPYANVLAPCVYSNTIAFSSTCRLSELPLIAQDTLAPTVADIMNRVLVSHQWMGQRFKEFLENADPDDDFKNLLRATTAIVISSDVRPSYYWAVTGAIHLDPNYLWLTPDERDTINQAPDFRAAFGGQLAFKMPWRYVKNNNYASFSYPSDTRITRSAASGELSFASLMYHELAHANDFFPRTIWSQLNPRDRILDAVNDILKDTGAQSDILTKALPLTGPEMFRLAQVRFHGETPTGTEKNYTPSDVSNFFSIEAAPQFYSYSSTRENYAILFDGFMMKARYGVDRDVAVTNQPQNENEEHIVNWGQRGRIGETNIKPRVSFVSRRILPEFVEADTIINALPSPINMQAGKTWAENLAISPTLNKQQVNNKEAIIDVQRLPQEGNFFFEKELPSRENDN